MSFLNKNNILLIYPGIRIIIAVISHDSPLVGFNASAVILLPLFVRGTSSWLLSLVFTLKKNASLRHVYF